DSYVPRPLLNAFPTRRSSDLRDVVGGDCWRHLQVDDGGLPEKELHYAGRGREALQFRDDSNAADANRQAIRPEAVRHRLKCVARSEEHTSELQSRGQLVCRLR